jgi:hypothetical protein
VRKVIHNSIGNCYYFIWIKVKSMSSKSNMAIEEVGKKYCCTIYINEVTITKTGGVTLVCCCEDMKQTGQVD